jgi:hypothetical protein
MAPQKPTASTKEHVGESHVNIPEFGFRNPSLEFSNIAINQAQEIERDDGSNNASG